MLRRLIAFGLVALSLGTACSRGDAGSLQQQTRTPTAAPTTTPSQAPARADAGSAGRARGDERRSKIGFRSRAQFNEHFQKHGAEFGHITQDEYLREAQALRDAPVGGNIEEIRRNDGTTSRFDRSTGAFLAFNRDGTIRTFFKPNDGEAYFRRQASRVH
jgi:hypothetical protein